MGIDHAVSKIMKYVLNHELQEETNIEE